MSLAVVSQSRCPKGFKCTIYRKGTLQKFAPYSREDGLVELVTIYHDLLRTNIAETRQTFANRKDRLCRRVSAGASTHESFEPGRPKGLKEHVWVDSERRELHFYSSARLDGLVTRVEVSGHKTYLVFDGTKDPLTYRSVSYLDSEMTNTEIAPDKHIRKLAEKFRRSPEVIHAHQHLIAWFCLACAFAIGCNVVCDVRVRSDRFCLSRHS